MRPTKRKCGPCRQCCITLEVPSLGLAQDEPCPELCSRGCGIYKKRPPVCRDFECAWLNGLLGPADRPDRTKHIIWPTQMGGSDGARMTVLQCSIAEGAKRHKKTISWLMDKSYVAPITIVQGDRNELYHYGRHVITWHGKELIRLDFTEDGRQIIGASVRPAVA